MTTDRIRSILVAVRDLHHLPRKELQRVGNLARAAGASVELFHAIDLPDPGRSYPETATRAAVQSQRTKLADHSRRKLEQFAHDPALRRLTVRCTAVWDYPPHEAIVRRAAATRADMVVATSHHHGLRTRLTLRNTDWELIRHCPVPLLLVKSPRPYVKPLVLAAVDPFHAHAKPTDLDRRLLQMGSDVASLLHGRLHIFHACLSLMLVAQAPVSAAPLLVSPEAESVYEQQVARQVFKLAQRAGIGKNACHLRIGDTAAELAAVVRRTHASLVVMGAVSRSGLARMFIGNTAERMLDRLSCDVLIVKPRRFRSNVMRLRPSVVSTSLPLRAAA